MEKRWWIVVIVVIICVIIVGILLALTKKDEFNLTKDNLVNFQESGTTCVNLLHSMDVSVLDKLEDLGIEPTQMELKRTGRGNTDWACILYFSQNSISNESISLTKERINISLEDLKNNILYSPRGIIPDDYKGTTYYFNSSIVNTPEGKKIKWGTSFEEENDNYWKALVINKFYFYDKKNKILTYVTYGESNGFGTGDIVPDWFKNIAPNFFEEKNDINTILKRYPVLHKSIDLMDLNGLISRPPLYSGFGWSTIIYGSNNKFISINLIAGYTSSAKIIKTYDNSSDACSFFKERLDYCNQHCSAGICCCSYCNKNIGILAESHGSTGSADGTEVNYHNYDEYLKCSDLLDEVKSNINFFS